MYIDVYMCIYIYIYTYIYIHTYFRGFERGELHEGGRAGGLAMHLELVDGPAGDHRLLSDFCAYVSYLTSWLLYLLHHYMFVYR